MTRPTLDLSLYLIIGPGHVAGDPAPLVRAAVAGGVSLVQIRDKESSTRVQVSEARRVKDALAGTGVPLLINDRVDVALAAGADGVHIGQEDMAPADARRLLGPNKILGLTVKRETHCRSVDPGVVDYASIGGVFRTLSKRNPDPPIGLDGLKHLTAVLTAAAPGLPRCAIAGIGREQAASVIAAGTDGICVVRAITEADDPEAAARDLRIAVDTARRDNERAFA